MSDKRQPLIWVHAHHSSFTYPYTSIEHCILLIFSSPICKCMPAQLSNHNHIPSIEKQELCPKCISSFSFYFSINFMFVKHFNLILGMQSQQQQRWRSTSTWDLGYIDNSIWIVVQGTELHQNVTAGVILTEQSLVLQSVTRASAGDYTCLAANTEGRGTSNPVTLRVRCKYIRYSIITL